jgi:FHS family L-fucose permease-like MFS transporter
MLSPSSISTRSLGILAYFVGSIIFFLYCVDVLQKFDTKDIICWFITAFGFMFLQPQWEFSSLPLLFTVGLGFSIQQIVANPLAIKMEAPHEKRQ